jgi:hypothetical protein
MSTTEPRAFRSLVMGAVLLCAGLSTAETAKPVVYAVMDPTCAPVAFDDAFAQLAIDVTKDGDTICTCPGDECFSKEWNRALQQQHIAVTFRLIHPPNGEPVPFPYFTTDRNLCIVFRGRLLRIGENLINRDYPALAPH